ncbi:MAG: GGDEF domain-containing protein [Dongiaceae bacterium]
MSLDKVTLIAVGSLVIALGGVVLLLIWTQMRHAYALLWVASAQVVYGAGTFLILAYYDSGNAPALLLGTLISGAAPVLVLAGVWSFVHGRVPLDAAAAAVLVFSIVVAGTERLYGIEAASVASFAGWVGMLTAAIVVLWRDRAEALPARWGLSGVFALHAAVYAAGIRDVGGGELGLGEVPSLNSWFGLVYFEGLIYAIGTAAFMALLCNERDKANLIRAARTDTLTGAVSRGAFFERGQRLLLRCRDSKTPLSLIVFDLDHFKTINDTYGHHTGDHVLTAFADVVRSVLRPNDLFGRHGGEEFAVVLPGAGVEAAYVIAERIRRAFADRTTAVGGNSIGATVSAGVAVAAAGAPFQAALDAADRAMYWAKNLGRNRVGRADENPSRDDNIVRVA